MPSPSFNESINDDDTPQEKKNVERMGVRDNAKRLDLISKDCPVHEK
jgi:hypothetical protein